MSKQETLFEDKINELEKIIEELETGEIPLEESIEKYTKAMKLVKECDEKLKKIEQKVNKVVSQTGEITDFNIDEENA